LVVVTLRIGDVLLSTPVIRSLRLAWPQAEIDALVLKGTEGVLLRNPDINHVLTVPARPALWEHFRLVSRLFRRYDLALTPLMGDRSTLYAWLAGRTRIGMQDGSRKHRWKQHLLSSWASYDHVHTHTVLSGLGLMDVLGIKRAPEVVVSWGDADEDAVASALPFDVRRERFAVLHPYPKFPYKMWRRENWVELAEWLQERGMRTVLTGSAAPDELAYIEQTLRAMPAGTLSMAGKLNMPENAFLISRAQCYVGPDTALTHIAAAVGTATVALFGPSNPVKWGPWPKCYAGDRNPYVMHGTQRLNNVMLVQDEGDCVPCMEEGCERNISSLSECLQNLPATAAIKALKELWQCAGKRK
jgi:heptosyltransferase-3